MSARLAIGIGATTSARVDDVVALVRASLATLATRATHGSSATHQEPREFVVATIDRRVSLAHDIARVFACDVVTFDAPTLANVDGASARSERSLVAVGTSSVAEAAALVALRPARAHLVVTRTTGRHCTCAIAEVV